MAAETSNPFAASPTAAESPQPRPLWRSARFWIPTFVCMLAALAVPVAFLIGAIAGQGQIYNNLASHQQARIEAFLAEDPNAFGELTVRHASNGWAFPIGSVETQEDWDRLSDQLHKMFGDELAEDMMRSVSVQ